MYIQNDDNYRVELWKKWKLRILHCIKQYKAQLRNKNIDVFSNTNFDDKKKNSNLDFEDLIKVDKKKLESAFNIKIDENTIKNNTTNYMNEISSSITADTSNAKKEFDDNIKSITKSLIEDYAKNPKESIEMSGMKLPVIYTNDVDKIVQQIINILNSGNLTDLSSVTNKNIEKLNNIVLEN